MSSIPGKAGEHRPPAIYRGFLLAPHDLENLRAHLLLLDLPLIDSDRSYPGAASLYSLDYIAKEYSLQVKADGQSEWKTVDTVYDNTDLETDRLLAEPVAARYVRLSVSKPDQSEGAAARIYEFKVY